MIEASCAGCGEEIERKSAVLHGPPVELAELQEVDLVPKRHLCILCYAMVIQVIEKRRSVHA